MPCEDGQIRAAYHAQKIEQECPQTQWKKITASMVCDVLIFETLEWISIPENIKVSIIISNCEFFFFFCPFEL